MYDLERVGNLVEAGLWAAVACVCLVQACRVRGRLRRVFAGLSIAFLAFGASDVVEAHTGTWWRPVWLLVWKGMCLTAIGLGFWQYYRISK